MRITEWCPSCEAEVSISASREWQKCPECRERIAPCSVYRHRHDEEPRSIEMCICTGYIPVARVKNDVIHVKAVREFNRVNYYYINFYGEPTKMFRTLVQAKEHIQALFSEFEGFEMI